MEISSSSPSKVSCLEDDILDPRVQIELENLNAATDEINSLEAGLEEANNAFRISLNETSVQLQVLSKKLGSCVEKARPYYEAREKAKNLQLDCQRAAVQYQRANAVHQAARETISLAEERFAALREKEGSIQRKFNSAWQEMLNHATMKIVEAEAQKAASEREHQKRAGSYTIAEIEVQDLERRLKSAINKSRPYFNHRTATQIKLEAQKDKIYKLQKEVTLAKNNYSLTLRNLEHISEEIHELRRTNGKREPGVGAEVDQCEAFVERAPSRESIFVDSKADKEHEYWSNLKDKLDELKNNEEECFSTNPEMKELTSSLAKDSGRERTIVEGEVTESQGIKPNRDNESTKNWYQEDNNDHNSNHEITQNFYQEVTQNMNQEVTDDQNMNQEVTEDQNMNQGVTQMNQEVTQNWNRNQEVIDNRNQEVTQKWNNEVGPTQHKNREATDTQNMNNEITQNRNKEVTDTHNKNQPYHQVITENSNKGEPLKDTKRGPTIGGGEEILARAYKSLPNIIIIEKEGTGTKVIGDEDFCSIRAGKEANDRPVENKPNFVFDLEGNCEVMSNEGNDKS